MAKPIPQWHPPGGFHYFEGDVKLEARTLEKLYGTVESYRAENYLPSGDVEGDVNMYICGNWPTYCYGVDMVVVTSVNPATAASELLNDITVWAKNILHSNKRRVTVSDDLAEQRAKICLGCKYNINWRSGCGACIVAAERISASVRQARETKSSKVLGGCSKMRHDNRSAIFFDRDEFVTTGDLPDHCWLKL